MASTYEASVSIKAFRGLMQVGDGRNLVLQYAVDAVNCDTAGGSLAPMKKGVQIAGSLPAPIGTLALLYRRFPPKGGDNEVLVAAAGTKLYAREMSATTWTEVYSGITSDNLDYVAYEVNDETLGTIDVLLLTSAADGMFCVYGNDLHVATVATPYKFGILTRHAERIWGSGITDKPDLLVYSAPFDPFDWAANTEIPEDGSGEVSQPSWDGDSFVALRVFGDQLLAFKKNRIWRILGTDPGSYIMKEQYGGGTIVENSVIVHTDNALMLGNTGLMLYDGVSVNNFKQQQIQNVVSRINMQYIGKAYAAMWGGKYCLSVPLDSSATNNAIIIFDTEESTFNFMEEVNAKAFLSVGEDLYYTTDTTPGTVWKMGTGDALPVLWRSGYQSLGRVNAVKSSFAVYLTLQSSDVISFDVTIRTEKKEKKKTLLLTSLEKTKRINIGNSGRWIQIELSTDSPKDWKLVGGVQIEMEYDID
jgi:hypothetical protein